MKHVNIGRGTIWGNPYKVGRTCQRCGQRHGKGETLKCYRRYLWQRINDGSGFDKRLAELGRDIIDGTVVLRCPGCGVGSKTCHGRILEAAAIWSVG